MKCFTIISDGPSSSGSPGDLELNAIDADDPEISDYNMIPDTALMADKPRSCLQVKFEIDDDT